MRKLKLHDLNVKGKKALVRTDFNVPLDSTGTITDDSRIVAALPTIKYVLEKGGSCILMSHMGRPKGKTVPEMSLAPVAKRLAELLGQPVYMASDCIGSKVEHKAKELKAGGVMLLENLRFYPGEEKPESDPEFAKQLASLGDLYIDDAFGSAHRAHASITEVPKYFPKLSAMGLLLEKEVRYLKETLASPKRPFVTLIGGAKISSKIGVLKALLPKVDALLIGGAMAYTFLKAQGIDIGKSLFEPEFVDEAHRILQSYLAANKKILLPKDIVVTDSIQDHKIIETVTLEEGIPSGMEGVDIGPLTIERFKKEFESARTILWNGPVGVYEVRPFAKGTDEIAIILSSLAATTIVGGGDSVAAVKKVHLSHAFSHLSTGGGATLELLELGTLPGIEALTNF